MTVAQLIPTPDPLQVPWGWFQILMTVTFFLHLVVMNLLLGGSLITFFHHAAGRTTDTNRFIASKLPFTVAFTINFGVAPLLFLQVLYGHLFYSSSLLMAFYWLLIVAILIFTYYGTYIYSLKYDRIADFRALFSGAIAGMLLVVAFLFTCNLALMVTPESWPAYFTHARGNFLDFGDPTLLPRFLHSVFGSLAVAGLAIALYYDFRKRRGDTEVEAGISRGISWFLWGTILNLGAGTWYWGSLPPAVRSLTADGGAFFLIFLVLGIASAILSLIYGSVNRVRPAAFLLLIALLCMVLVREFARRMTLAPWFTTSDLPVHTQYSPLFTFLLIFLAGIGLIWYMIRLVLTDKEVRS